VNEDTHAENDQKRCSGKGQIGQGLERRKEFVLSSLLSETGVIGEGAHIVDEGHYLGIMTR